MEPSQAATRDFLIEELRKDLVGPGAADEELTDRPTTRYLAGILYPPKTAVDTEEDKDSGDAPEADDDIDPGTLMASTFNPSAIGLSFAVENGTSLSIRVRCATYTETESEKEGRRSTWKRRPLEIAPVVLEGKPGEGRTVLAPGLELFHRMRVSSGSLHVTLSLLNVHSEAPPEGLADPFCFFQPEIEVTGAQAGRKVFLDRSKSLSGQGDPEARMNALLYRHVPEFAVGHGCAVAWEAAEGRAATRLWTQIVPDYEVPQLSPDTEMPDQSLEMDRLASAPDGEALRASLDPLPKLYRQWIADNQRALEAMPAEYREAGRENLKRCAEIADRMEAGRDLVCQDPAARRAFQLANRVMDLQRERTEVARAAGADDEPAQPTGPARHAWRAFQLGFILLCIPSIVDPHGRDRKIVDLLWFPTGGGKTEAYLGLTAFTIFLRRIRNQGASQAAGVTVLMRYTLRLLTIQQFQRAATMIMACETIRRENPEALGKEPISLGLWVGSAATPNTLLEAKDALQKLLAGEEVLEGNPYQLLACPWCGQNLTPRDYRVGVRLEIRCSRAGCSFEGGMPLWIVDDDVYAEQPSLLIATVDKFARLPWLEKASALFGRSGSRHLPPELIVQDELHLISGPLGTMVGLYETAIEALCSQEGIGAKVIASTATIRGAPEQVRGLFDRPVVQFPPPAIDARDTYFAREVSTVEVPGRKFLGVHAPGKSVKTALLRTYALLLQRVYEHRSDPLYRDPYWTLVGYFNSLRELGGARRLVDDDVIARIRGLASKLDGKVLEREITLVKELTSRAGSSEIPEILELMANTMGQDGALDVLLATNMISVGVDIDRLGLMVVNGQPKSSAEYIQATSRIGRRYAGLVITLYNWSRPRDRSHYERFRTYHSALYRHVEASSVTPFSPRARDRGLAAVVITIMRHLIPEMTPETAAGLLKADSEGARRVVDMILQRTGSIDPAEREMVATQIEGILGRWRLLARAESLRYGKDYRHPEAPHLMEAIETASEGFSGFRVLNSLREVEAESELQFLREVG